MRAYAVFDYLRTYSGYPFRLKDYLLRFRSSAKLVGIPLNYADVEIKKSIITILKNCPGEAGIRLLLSGGYTNDSFTPKNPNFFILAEDIPHYPPTLFSSGVKLITCEFQRFIPKAKTTNYLNSISLFPARKKEKAFEVLYHRNGEIFEASRNNFFIVKTGKLITPKDNILMGITRKVVLELAGNSANDLKVEERMVHFSELKDADEAFITGSSKGIIPVVQIDKIKIGNGKPGSITKALKKRFEDYTQLKKR